MPRRIRIRRRSRAAGGFAACSVAAGIALVTLAGRHLPASPAAAAGPPGRGAAAVIAYARAQLGKPYLWGGAGPAAFDCSGLAMQAYTAAGITIPRTSQDQWAWGPHVSAPGPGDLVFFAGADGTAASPGHVGIVVDPARHLMIEAYAAGYPIRYSQFGKPGSPPGDSDPVGYTDPAARGGT